MSISSPQLSFAGGRRAAEARLALIDPARYGASRNHLDGAVTRLSPYIRHGVLTLAEVRDAVFDRLKGMGERDAPLQGELFGDASQAQGWSPAQRRAGEKLINELGWRDYWQRLWIQLGDGIWVDREPYKSGHSPDSYAAELPADLWTPELMVLPRSRTLTLEVLPGIAATADRAAPTDMPLTNQVAEGTTPLPCLTPSPVPITTEAAPAPAPSGHGPDTFNR